MRRETGKEQAVRVRRNEGVATHIDPKPCVGSIWPFLKEDIVWVARVLRRTLGDEEEGIEGNSSIVVGDQLLDDGLIDIHRVDELAYYLAAGQIDHARGAVVHLVCKQQLVLIVDVIRKVELLVRSHQKPTKARPEERTVGWLRKEAFRNHGRDLEGHSVSRLRPELNLEPALQFGPPRAKPALLGNAKIEIISISAVSCVDRKDSVLLMGMSGQFGAHGV